MINNQEFSEIFNSNIEYSFKAPARINLIGEHIDYNGGMVLPCAISLYTRCFISIRNDSKIVLKSKSFDNLIEVNFSNLDYNSNNDWANYPIGVFKVLKDKGFNIPYGLNIYYETEIPLGSGLSSSAAILDLTVYAINEIYNLNIDRLNIALIAQEVENKYCGLSCGIMDEAIISLGMKNKALLFDCNKITYKYIDMKEGDYTYVVMKTNKPRKLTESKYNERVFECNKALKYIKTKYNIHSLCELDSKYLLDVESLLNDDVLYRRVKHVVLENERVYKYAKALTLGNYNELGKLLNESDESLKNNYEVTGTHLDTITEAARLAGAIGARMTGAGFGGCAIALIKRNDFKDFSKKVKEYYLNKTNIQCDLFLVDIVDGVNNN